MSIHHVRQHHWLNGTLSTVEHFFESLEEAMEHVASTDAHTVKVYSESGELVHSASNAEVNTYA
jgi:hypothetical protein